MELSSKNLIIKSLSKLDIENLISNESDPDKVFLYKDIVQKMSENKRYELFLSLWKIYANKNEVGFLRFNHAPDRYGGSEVYFEIYEEYQNNGYASEALKTFCEYGFTDQRVHFIYGVVKDNPAAARVLAKNKFKYREESDDGNIFERYK